MDNSDKWYISDEEKQHLIDILTDELPLLRARAGIPQEDLAKVIGFTRQTYSSIERKVRPMSWNIFLALIFFFDTNASTHSEIRSIGAYPGDIIARLNGSPDRTDTMIGNIFGGDKDILGKLDDKAEYVIKSVIMAEYARCTGLPIDTVVKSFGGNDAFAAPEK